MQPVIPATRKQDSNFIFGGEMSYESFTSTRWSSRNRYLSVLSIPLSYTALAPYNTHNTARDATQNEHNIRQYANKLIKELINAKSLVRHWLLCFGAAILEFVRSVEINYLLSNAKGFYAFMPFLCGFFLVWSNYNFDLDL